MSRSQFPIKRRRPYTAEEFWLRVDRTSQDGCWPWLAGATSGGRGLLMWRGKRRLAYRIAWELANGAPPPEDRYVCHACDNPQCVRPNHLFIGTSAENHEDMRTKGRDSAPPSHFGEMHPMAKRGDATVRLVREAYAKGEATIEEVAAQFDIHPQTVRDWVRGKSRRTAGGPIVTAGWQDVA